MSKVTRSPVRCPTWKRAVMGLVFLTGFVPTRLDIPDPFPTTNRRGTVPAGIAEGRPSADQADEHRDSGLPAVRVASPGPASLEVTGALSVTLFGSYVDWSGNAGVELTAAVLQEGVVVAATADRQVSDTAGHARLRFRAASDDPAGAFPRGFLVPGNEIVVNARGHEPLAVGLPRLAADIDPSSDRIAGRGPPMARVRVELRDATGGAVRLDQSVDVDSEGRFTLLLAGALDLSPSDFGEVVLGSGGSNRIAARVALPSVQVDVGRPAACGWNRDERLLVEVLDDSGRSKYGGCDEPRRQPVETGDRIVLHRGAGFLVPGAPPTVTTIVPSFAAEMEPLSGRLHGQGPPNGRLSLALGSAFRAVSRQEVVTDQRGRFEVPAPVGPGWLLDVAWDAGNGIRVSHAFGSPTAFVGVGNGVVAAWIGGVGEGSSLDLALLDAAGSSTAPVAFAEAGWSELPWQGDWFSALDSDVPLAPMAGDELEVSLDGKDPTRLVVPRLGASYDWSTGVLGGTALPGSRVLVTFAGDTATSPSRDPVVAAADSSGRFSVALSGGAPVDSGTWGLVVVESGAAPVAFYAAWSSGRLELDLLTGWLRCLVNAGETVTVTARTPAGGLRAAGTGRSGGLLSLSGESLRVPVRPRWSVSLAADPATGRIDLAPGDEVSACTDRGCETFLVPELGVEGDPTTDLLRGSTEPGAEVALTVASRADGDPAHRGSSFTGRATAGPDGRFEHSLAGEFDLRRGDFVTAGITLPAGHRVVLGQRLPCLDLDLDNGWLTGLPSALEVGVPITVTLVREGAPGTNVLGETGSPFTPAGFLVRLGRDGSIAPKAGDRLEVRIGASETPLTMEVPRLEAAMDWPGERVRGHWSGAGTLELHSGSTYAYPQPSADGSFDLAITRPGVGNEPWAQPGRVAALVAWLDTGDTVRRRLVHPRVSIEVGGAGVEARVQPLADVAAELLDGQGSVIASAVGRAREYLTEGLDGDPTNNAFLTLRRSGRPIPMEAGQSVRLFTADAEVRVDVPALTTTADWEVASITGSGPPGSRFSWAVQSDRRCWLTEGYSWEWPQDARIWSSGSPLSQTASGDFTLGPMRFEPGKRYMIGFLGPEGHRAYRTGMRASAEVELAAGNVAGCAQPLSVVAADLLEEGGLLRASGQTLADADGRYRLSLLDAATRPAAVQPTDALVLRSAGECAVLSETYVRAAWDGAEAIVGEATAGRSAWATWLPDSPYAAAPYPQLESGLRPLWYPFVSPIAVDGRGRFRVPAGEIDAWGKPWRLADVLAVRISTEIEPGRHTVAVATRRQAVYLPIAPARH